MPFKPEVRVLGFDDAPNQRGDARVPVVGVVMRAGQYVEAVLRTDVTGDGDDATERLASTVMDYPGRRSLAAVFTHNVVVAGFNTIDLRALHEAVGVPVVAVARGPPGLSEVKRALLGGIVPNGAAKWARIETVEHLAFPVADGAAVATPVGLSRDECEALLRLCTVRGALPEALRLAHLIGAGWVLGRSRGS